MYKIIFKFLDWLHYSMLHLFGTAIFIIIIGIILNGVYITKTGKWDIVSYYPEKEYQQVEKDTEEIIENTRIINNITDQLIDKGYKVHLGYRSSMIVENHKAILRVNNYKNFITISRKYNDEKTFKVWKSVKWFFIRPIFIFAVIEIFLYLCILSYADKKEGELQ